MPGEQIRIGLISDTHGLLRPEALEALAGVQEIIHAGDIGTPAIIEGLSALAPVHAVRGNNDREPWADKVPLRLDLMRGGVRIHVLHDVKELAVPRERGRFDVVVAGHSHKPGVIAEGRILLVNPGSAGPRRFKLPVTIGYLTISDGAASAEIRNLL
jgi:putative phosphoesterase